ncbi:MAG: hypothetical protein HDR00_08080 [Lachnospiraceae bacterium]|nr:hypothetical protein [Lachnospiraceae bacterium]
MDGRFTYEGESYAFVVNTRTEEIYTSLRLQELKESVRKESPTTCYTKWDHLEEGNFHLFFETYCRECTSGNTGTGDL